MASMPFVIQDLPTHSDHMRPGIVLHQEEPRAYCTSRPWVLTISLRISSRYLTAVKVPLAMTWRSVLSKDMPPQTITNPSPNWSCWLMLQAAYRPPQLIQTLSCLSPVLSVNLHTIWRKQGANGGPVNSGVLWRMPIQNGQIYIPEV